MNNKIKLSAVTSAVVLSATLFVGCGSDSSSSISGTIPSVGGQGLAKYVKDADAFLDANFDGIKNNGELSVKTNATGKYSISGIIPSDYQIVLAGGVNSATGAAVPTTIAPKGYTIASPLTTMVAAIPADEREQFLKDMGITEANLNVDYNTVAFGASIAKVVALKSVVETMMASTGAANLDAIKNIATAVKNTVATTSDLTGDDFYTRLSTNVQAETGIDVSADITAVKDEAQAVAKATDKDSLDTAVANAEKANAISAVVASIEKQSTLSLSSQTITFGGSSVVLDENNNFLTNHAVLTSEESLTDFFNIKFNVNTSFSKPLEKTAELSVKIILDSNSTKFAQLTIPNIKISTAANTFNINIPSGTEITGTTSGLSLATQVAASTSSALNLSATDGEVDFSIQNLLNAFGTNSAISDYIDSFNTRATVEEKYKVVIGYKITDDLNATNISDINTSVASVRNNTDLAFDATELSSFDSNVTAALNTTNALTLANNFNDVSSDLGANYVGFSGTVFVGSKEAFDDAVEAQAVAIDKLQLKDNTITIGDVTTTILRGEFKTVEHDKVDENLTSLYNTSFALENLADARHSLEDGDVKNLTLGIYIENVTTTTNKQRLFVIMDKVELTRTAGTDASNNDGEYSVKVLDGAKLQGYAIKADGTTKVSASLDNATSNGSVVTTDGAIVKYDLSNAIAKFKESNPSFSDLETYFNTQGKYKVRLFITGVDGVINAKDAVNIADDFKAFDVANTAITTAFGSDTFEISGNVNIGYSATQVATDTMAATTSALDTMSISNVTSNLTLPTSITGQDGTIAWSVPSGTTALTNTGTIVRTLKDQTITLTATITGIYNNKTVTQTKDFTVVVKALTDAEVVDMAKTALTLDASQSTGTTLQSSYTNSTLGGTDLASIVWTSTTSGALDDTNTTLVNTTATAITDVNLTATITRDSDSTTKDFVITIQPTDASVLIVDRNIFNTWKNDLNTTSANVTLPTFTTGTTATWTTDNSSIMTNIGVMTKSATDKNVTLTATLTRGTEPKIELTNTITVTADPDMALVLGVMNTFASNYNTTAQALDINSTNGSVGLALTGDTNGTTVTWTKSVDRATATTVSGTDTTASTAVAQTVSYTATFVRNDYNETSTYTYTILADENRALSESNSTLVFDSLNNSSMGTITQSSSTINAIYTSTDTDYMVKIPLLITSKDGYGSILANQTISLTQSLASGTAGSTVKFENTDGNTITSIDTNSTGQAVVWFEVKNDTAVDGNYTVTTGAGDISVVVKSDPTVEFDQTATAGGAAVSGVTLTARNSNATQVEFQTATYAAQTPGKEMYVSVNGGKAKVVFPGEFIGNSFSITVGSTEYIGTFSEADIYNPVSVSAI